ncbi:LysR family transcriptional regulator [Alteromonas sp. ASW11-130]|uniref:LysR family transcriptional regulator n=1 Tax=Alteromonas sp. ASW11-130 TaxID=3015775 RepID=UPI0022427240|nr:LysR family transcriptional regulator [Alteromonas sp. ASW11-130]MCW8092776.1 LysR family transcriptional regulator [Alteromonas sp. ASW11-130]
MDLRNLRYFVSVYETGSFSAASKRQYIAQPSISAAIKLLEASLSKPLFVRYPRGVKPTQAGHQLYPLAQQLLGQAAAIKYLLKEENPKQPFRLGLVKGLGVARISDVLKRFTSQVNALELTLVPPEEKCDARIINYELLKTHEDFVSMWQDDFQWVMPMDHPLSLKEEIDISDLANVAFIQREPCEGWNLLREALSQAHILPDIRARIQTIDYAIGLVKAGVGCAFIPVAENADYLNDIVCRPVKGVCLTRHIGVAFENRTSVVEILVQLVSGS